MNNIEKSNFSYIKNIFESISNEYDFMNDLMTFKNHSKWKEEIVEISIDSSPKKILDIATGTGDVVFSMYKEFKNRLVGLDIADKMIDLAKLKQVKKGLKDQDISFIQGDGEDLGFSDNSCLLYTSPSPRDVEESRMPSSA
mgnify:CR=1 FL=1